MPKKRKIVRNLKKVSRVVLGEGYLISRCIELVKMYALVDIDLGLTVGQNDMVSDALISKHIVSVKHSVSGKPGEKPKKIRLVAEVLE